MHFLKPLLAIIAGLAAAASTSARAQAERLPVAEASAPPVYGELLAEYVADGGVRYAAWHADADDLQALREVVGFYAGTRPPDGRSAALAWHLNAYNAWILHNILDKYPTDGPLDGEMFFFHGDRIRISGEKTSFDHLEQDVIRKRFDEPRIHFALNCASQSCPPLHHEPFTAANLDGTLERLTRAFINDHPQGVVAGDARTVRVSKVFEWYAADFGGKQGIIPYVNRYREQPVAASAELEFMDYSWQLNETR